MKNVLSIFSYLLINANVVFAEESIPDLKIQKLENVIYLHTSFERYDGFGIVASNGLIVLDNESAYFIDTPTSAKDTRRLVEWARERDFTVEASISTHFHDDSASGIEWLNSQSIPTYASSLTNRLLGKSNQTQAIHSLEETSFWLVKDLIEVYYPGAGHTQDNVVVWLPKQSVLFGGCFVKTESLGNLSDAVLEAWPESAQKLISRYGNAALVVPGHGKVGDASLLVRTRTLALEALSSNNPIQPDAGTSDD